MFIILFSRATTALEVKMTTKIKIKHEYLENTMEGLQCYNCKAVPGLTEDIVVLIDPTNFVKNVVNLTVSVDLQF